MQAGIPEKSFDWKKWLPLGVGVLAVIGLIFQRASFKQSIDFEKTATQSALLQASAAVQESGGQIDAATAEALQNLVSTQEY